MKIAYFDCFSGISGDMCLGALLDTGVSFEKLKDELGKLPLDGYVLCREKVKRNGIAATSLEVELLEVNQTERRLEDIRRIIDSSPLPEEVKEKSKAVFERLAVAEANVHDTGPENIHFHEVGAVDAIVDVVGTVLGLYLLGVEKIYASPLPMGKGFIKCAHGIIPSPAPATLEILRDVPIFGTNIEGELVTPTGAALISALAEGFTDLPAMTIEKIGYGVGKKVMEHPNLLRLIVGELRGRGVAGPISCSGSHDTGRTCVDLHAYQNTHNHEHGPCADDKKNRHGEGHHRPGGIHGKVRDDDHCDHALEYGS